LKKVFAMALVQQFRLFVYDPTLDDGAYKAIGDLWAASEKEALLQLQANTSRIMTLVEGGGKVAMQSDGVQFIARSHAEKDRWPDVQTGRLPHSDNQVTRDDFERGRL
jgi:hypothetical protein